MKKICGDCKHIAFKHGDIEDLGLCGISWMSLREGNIKFNDKACSKFKAPIYDEFGEEIEEGGIIG